jgi:hypothetical protein
MEFRFEDILKNLIPGSVLLSAIALFFFNTTSFQGIIIIASDLKDYSAVVLVGILVGCYITGFMNDALSSFLEYHFIHRLFGRPSYNLLMGKSERYSLINYETIINNVKNKFPNDLSLVFNNNKANNRKVTVRIFKYANILKIQNDKAEVTAMIKENYYSYVFSRNLFFSVMFSIFFLIMRYHHSLTIFSYVSFLLIILLLAFRRRERDYYNTRYILIASSF